VPRPVRPGRTRGGERGHFPLPRNSGECRRGGEFVETGHRHDVEFKNGQKSRKN